MRTSERKVAIFIVICTLLLTVFGYSWKKRKDLPHISAPLVNITTPFFYGSNEALDKLKDSADIWQRALWNKNENEKLKAQLLEQKADMTNYDELVAENMRLRQLLRFKTNSNKFSLAPAHIIARDFGYGMKTFTIDLGANQGIARYMPVVAPGGIVGFVSEVFANSAKVQSILDPRTSVGVIVQRPESRLTSLVKGQVYSATNLSLVDVPKDADVLQGDTLITSGYGGVYPKGIIVGYVGEIKTNSEGYVNKAQVQPAVNFYKLEEVFVITGSDEPVPVWQKREIKLIPSTKRDKVEGVKGAVNNAVH